ncbi:MAG: N-acetyltransferase [Burkholderiaceae bacterium]|nr:MAG: N-acetyltransferase [Burkholderiaceae bacterium]
MMIALDNPLEFEGGSIRPLKPGDVHAGYVDGLNDPQVNRYLVGVRQSVQSTESVMQFVRQNIEAPDAALFGIWQAGQDQHCGTIRLHAIERIHHSAHIGVCLFDRRAWYKGMASCAVNVLTQWALETMHLRWIEAGMYADNLASEKTFLAAGYEWVYDVQDKYLFEGRAAAAKVYAARNRLWQKPS